MTTHFDRQAASGRASTAVGQRFGCTAWVIAVVLVYQASVAANEVDGFTEPNRKVNVAAVETGTISAIHVREGDVVEKGQILVQLDDAVYRALLAIAEEGMHSRGQLKSAEAELSMRRQRLEKLEALRMQGHARQEEVERAQADMEIAEARVLSANELLEIKRLEYNKVQIQLSRRAIRAPLDGVVSRLHKDEGEFVAPNDPYVMELVELDPLLGTFSVPSHLAVRLENGQQLSVFLEDVQQWVEGEIESIAPVTDAESGTIRLRVRIANGNGKFRSGERCTLQLQSPAPAARRRPRS